MDQTQQAAEQPQHEPNGQIDIAIAAADDFNKSRELGAEVAVNPADQAIAAPPQGTTATVEQLCGTDVSEQFGSVADAFSNMIYTATLGSATGLHGAVVAEVASVLSRVGDDLGNGSLIAGVFDKEAFAEAVDDLSAAVGKLNSKARQIAGRPRPSVLYSAVAALQRDCHAASKKSGWWSHKPTGLNLIEVIVNPKSDLEKLLGGALVAQKICLSHSELSEGVEGHRKGKMDDHLPHRPSLEVELGDAVIRIFDLAGALGFDLAGAIEEKMAFNRVRPDHKIEHREAAGGKAW